ncbi:MAG: tight adherence protein [Actinomycetota bacterium]|jgi:tight adherence protein B|nr:tight adherence protein [Actinomycetota bacterium]
MNPSSPLGDWAPLVGAALCGVALLLLLVETVLDWAPRAVGLAPRQRGRGLAAAVAGRAEAVGDSLLRGKGRAASLTSALDAAGVDLRPGALLAGVAAGTAVGLVGGGLLFSPFVGLVLGLAVPLLARVVLGVLTGRRQRRFSDQMPDTLQILSGTLRAGHGLAQGIQTVGQEAESPTAEEFRRLTIETRLGRDLVEGLNGVGDRVGGEDFRWVVQAVDIQRDVGGDLAEVLDTVASTIRDRTRIRRQVSALSAEGRMSAWVLMLLPFGLALVMFVTNPAYLSPLFASGTGHKLLVVAAVLLVAGGLWLRRIVKPIF